MSQYHKDTQTLLRKSDAELQAIAVRVAIINALDGKSHTIFKEEEMKQKKPKQKKTKDDWDNEVNALERIFGGWE